MGTPWASMIVAAEWRRLCHGIEASPRLALTLVPVLADVRVVQRRATRTGEDEIIAALCPFEVLADLVNLQSLHGLRGKRHCAPGLVGLRIGALPDLAIEGAGDCDSAEVDIKPPERQQLSLT